MRKLLVLVVGLCLFTSLAFAQEKAISTEADVEDLPVDEEVAVFKGDIIDNLCASSQKLENLADFVKTHTKQCALMPNCLVSGYSIFANGELTEFDNASNAKVAEFLRKADSKLQVVVKGEVVVDKLSLVSIENQE